MEGIIIRFPINNELSFFQDFQWKKGIPSDVDFTIEKSANEEEYWLCGDGHGNTTSIELYGNGKIAVSKEIIMDALIN